MSNDTTHGTAYGYVTAYTAAGGQTVHIVARYGTGWNDFTGAAVCGTAAKTKWGTGTAGVAWMTAGADITHNTPAEAAAATPGVCLRCRAAAAKMAAATPAAEDVTPAPAEAAAVTTEDTADTRATAAAESSAPGAVRVDMDASLTAAYCRGAAAAVTAYWQGAPGRAGCVDSVIVSVMGAGTSGPAARAEAAQDALEQLQAMVTSGPVTAGEYQTFRRENGVTLFVFGTWTD